MKEKILKATLTLSLSALLLPLCGQDDDRVVTLLFAGDIMGHDAQIEAARDDRTGAFSYESIFGYISPLLNSVDVTIGNLEVPLGGAPYRGYPVFSSPDELAVACRNAGFDILVTANNHTADRGAKGLVRTIRVLDSLGIRHTGTWANSHERDLLSPLMIAHHGIRVALLSYTYGTNGIVVPPPATVAYIDTLRAATDMIRADRLDADLKIVFIHWGIEYDTMPSPEQRMTAAALFRGGTDIIIGSHPHVLQPMNAIRDSLTVRDPVVWSLGNLVSNQRVRRTDGGAMVRIEIRARGDSLFISDAGYLLTWVYTPVEKGKRQYYILPCAEYEDNSLFFQTREQYNAMTLFLSDARRLFKSCNTGFREITWRDGIWQGVNK